MKKLFAILFALALVAGVFVQNAQADVHYVTSTGGAVTKDGTSWDNAYAGLQEALLAANSGDQIWVAKGTYKPSYDYGLIGGSRFYHFRMIEGVAIYGGFAGSENAVSERTNFGADQAHETILSGDLNGDDNYSVSSWTGTSDNCYHVFYHPSGLGLTNSAKIDGFTIKGGIANSEYPNNNGGGMANYPSSSPTIINCTFTSNLAYLHGSGMYNESSSPTLNNCTFTSNLAYLNGGGMYNENSSPTLANCTFTSNLVLNMGGGMYNSSSSPILTNCSFTSNTAGGGSGMYNSSSSPTLTNCTFTSNSAINGGGMFNQRSSPTLTNCTFTSNSSTVYHVSNGGGMYNNGYSSPSLTNCTFSSNTASSGGGGMFNYASSPTLTDCTFTSNSVIVPGGGGGGMHNTEASSTSLTNCTFTSNLAANGGGMYNSSSLTLTNCTFSSNSTQDGGGMFNCNSSTTLNNCIIWGNDATGNGDEFNIGSGTTTLNYSCYANESGDIYISGGTLATTNHNITSDPQFVGSSINPAHPYSIPGTSPCVDAGLDSVNSQDYDFRGELYLRKLNKTTGGFGTIDMGAYEYKIGDDPLTSVETGIAGTPKKFTLSQNYPNPFNPSTIISFSLAKNSFVSLKIFDFSGREVATIVFEEMSAGSYSKQWNAANMTSGIYFYSLQAGSFAETKKLIYLDNILR